MQIKYAILIFFMICSLGAIAQHESALNTIVFEGYLLTEDSIPLENALLINFRTTKMIKTNLNGYFKTSLNAGDSLMINHVAMSPKVVFANNNKASENKILVEYRTYMLNPVTNYNYEKEHEYVLETTKQIKAEIKEQILYDPNKQSGNDNRYDENENNPGVTILKLSPKTKKQQLPPD